MPVNVLVNNGGGGENIRLEFLINLNNRNEFFLHSGCAICHVGIYNSKEQSSEMVLQIKRKHLILRYRKFCRYNCFIIRQSLKWHNESIYLSIDKIWL